MLFVSPVSEKPTLYAQYASRFRVRRPNRVGFDEIIPKEVVAGAAAMVRPNDFVRIF